jgi:hypothetical protein
VDFDNSLIIHNKIMKDFFDQKFTANDNKELVENVVGIVKQENKTIDVPLAVNVAMAYLEDYQKLSNEDAFAKMLKNNLITQNQLDVLLKLNDYMATCDYSSYKKFETDMLNFQAANIDANDLLSSVEQKMLANYIKFCNNSYKLYEPYANSGAETTCGQCLKKNIRDILLGDGGGSLAGVGACLAYPPACAVLLPVLVTIGSAGAAAVRCPCCYGGSPCD